MCMYKPTVLLVLVTLCMLIVSGCLEQSAVQSPDENGSEKNNTLENTNSPPTVSMQAEPVSGLLPLPVSFSCDAVDVDGDTVAYLWDFDDDLTTNVSDPVHTFSTEGEYEVIVVVTDEYGASAMARCTITVVPPPSDWHITLIGAQTRQVNRSQFEIYLAQYEEVAWEDEGNIWTGLPLWYLVGIVDDVESDGSYTFNDDLAQRGYTIKLTAGDGWVTELKSYDIAYDSGYLVVDKLNGEPLPQYTPKGKPSWPLHLRGENVVCPNNIGNISTIELLNLPSESEDEDQPIRSFLRDLLLRFFPKWYHFLLEVKQYLTGTL